MKTKFKEFYKYSDDEIKKIWNECIFVFDTNVLLDLYRYSKDTSDKYIDILKKVKTEKTIWIPHQVGLEFHKKRITLISDLKNSYSEIKKTFESSIRGAQKKVDDEYHKEHPFLNLKSITSELENCLKNITEIIDKDEKTHPDWFNTDTILNELNELLKDNVGAEYSQERLYEICKEGKERYSSNIPPGYEDVDKPDERKYGDLVLWYQIIDKARESKKPIIFVTRDKKEDWWWKQSGQTIGPRYELKKEMLDVAGVEFHMYDSERFLEYASEHYSQTLDKEVLHEIKRFKSREERNYRMHKILRSREFKSLLAPEFVIQREILNEELAHLSRDLDLDEGILFEFNRDHEKIMHFMDRCTQENRIHPAMFQELVISQEKMQRIFIDLIENEKLSKDQFQPVLRFFERMNETYRTLSKYAENNESSKKWFDRMETNNYRLGRYFRERE